MSSYSLLFTSILLAAVGQLLMKCGMRIIGVFSITSLPEKLIPIFFNPYVFSGLSCFVISSVIWLVILSRTDLSLVYPMVSIAYIVVVFLSWIILKENVTALRWIGVAIICLGVYLISRS